MKKGSELQPLSWFLRSVCLRYRVDRILTNGARRYVAWATSTGQPARLGDWATAAEAQAACDEHRKAQAAAAAVRAAQEAA